MKNGATYFKWLVILVIFVLLFLTFRRCGKDINYSPTKTDTIKVRVDTIWKESKTDTQWVPKIRKVVEYKTEWKTDTLEIFEKIGVDSTNTFLKEYISYKYYQDTIATQYGYIVVIDTVTRSRIASRRTISKFDVPIIEKTITLTQPKRVVLYLGADLMGNQVTPLWGAGVNLSLRFKNDKIWKVGAMLNKTGETMYSFGAQIPIRLRKQ